MSAPGVEEESLTGLKLVQDDSPQDSPCHLVPREPTRESRLTEQKVKK